MTIVAGITIDIGGDNYSHASRRIVEITVLIIVKITVIYGDAGGIFQIHTVITGTAFQNSVKEI